MRESGRVTREATAFEAPDVRPSVGVFVETLCDLLDVGWVALRSRGGWLSICLLAWAPCWGYATDARLYRLALVAGVVAGFLPAAPPAQSRVGWWWTRTAATACVAVLAVALALVLWLNAAGTPLLGQQEHWAERVVVHLALSLAGFAVAHLRRMVSGPWARRVRALICRDWDAAAPAADRLALRAQRRPWLSTPRWRSRRRPAQISARRGRSRCWR